MGAEAQSAAVIPFPTSESQPHAGLVAFLFTDIEGSSLKWLNHRTAMQEALPAHDEILRKAIVAHSGEVFKTGGDAFSAAFPRPSDAIGAAIDAQQALARRDWSGVNGLAVRMAVHVGTAEKRDGDYFGPALNRVARLLALGHGGQVLVTSSGAELVAAERGDLDEALAAAKDSIRELTGIGFFYRLGDHFTLRLAKAGHHDEAARLLGYVDGEHARFKIAREGNEARARASALALMNEAMPPAELVQKLAEGAKLTEDEAMQLAVIA